MGGKFESSNGLSLTANQTCNTSPYASSTWEGNLGSMRVRKSNFYELKLEDSSLFGKISTT
jgi:hypothetical protein